MNAGTVRGPGSSMVARLDIDLDLADEAPAWTWECVYCGDGSAVPSTREEATENAGWHFAACQDNSDD